MSKSQKPTLFISYSHKDEEWKDRLTEQLGVLAQEGVLELWEDRRIAAGSHWQKEIEVAMTTASVAVLLISPAYLNSEFINGKEVPYLLQRRAERGLRVFPVVIKPCAWQAVGWLRQMQLRPRDGRPISAGNDNQIDSDLSNIAIEIYRLLGATNFSKRSNDEKAVPLSPDKISISRLPVTGKSVFGRSQELKILDRAWNDRSSNIVSIIAWGGVGKSALINHWLRRIGGENYRGAEKVYAWSFYRHGTGDRIVSADEFIVSALTWFGDADPTQGSAWEKGVRLAQLVREQRTLLLLDGLEPLQFPPGPQEGRLKDEALKAVLRELASHNPGLCLISSRIQVNDLDDFETPTVECLNLEHLSPTAGAQILKAQGVTGAETELKQASTDYGGHSLALTLLGSYLADAFDGNIKCRREIALQEDIRFGDKAQQVMAAYERWLGEGAELAVLRLIGLFDRPADEKALYALRASPRIPGLTDAIHNLSQKEWRQILSKLRRARLIAEVDAGEPDTLDAHPLVREHFGRQLKKQMPDAWKMGNDRLYEHFRQKAKELPETVLEMEPLFMAVVYGCNAGRHRDAFHEVLIPRIMREEQGYAVRELGMIGSVLTIFGYFTIGGNWGNPVTPNEPDYQGLEPEDQLSMLTQAGLYLTAARGYASEEVKACYNRVQELCEQLNKRSFLYSVLLSRWRYFLITGDLAEAVHLATDIYDLARYEDDSSLLIGAYRALSITIYFKGEFERARKYALMGIELWEAGTSNKPVAEVYTPVVTCLAVDAKALWHLGHPEKAVARVDEAVSLARKLGDLNALAAPALFMRCYIYHFCRQHQDILENAEELIEICMTQEFPLWLAIGLIMKGYAQAKLGKPKEGLALLSRGIQQFRDLKSWINVSYFLALQAEVLADLGRVEEGLSLLEEAKILTEKHSEYWWLAEVYRLKGEILWTKGTDLEEIENCFILALQVARLQKSRSLELRASLSLHRAWSNMNKEMKARDLLVKIREFITDDSDSDDIREARNLIEKYPENFNKEP